MPVRRDQTPSAGKRAKLAQFAARLPGRVCAGLLIAALAAPASVRATPDPDLEHAMLTLTNADRTSNGVNALLLDDRLLVVARNRSEDMVARNYFSHAIPPNGTQVFPLIEAQGIDYEAAAENLSQTTAARPAAARDAQNRFLDSAIHRANLLNARWRFIAVGVTPATNHTVFTVLFMLPFPSDPSYARLTTVATQIVVIPSQNAVESASPFETVVDTVLGRNLGLGGLD